MIGSESARRADAAPGSCLAPDPGRDFRDARRTETGGRAPGGLLVASVAKGRGRRAGRSHAEERSVLRAPGRPDEIDAVPGEAQRGGEGAAPPPRIEAPL